MLNGKQKDMIFCYDGIRRRKTSKLYREEETEITNFTFSMVYISIQNSVCLYLNIRFFTIPTVSPNSGITHSHSLLS